MSILFEPARIGSLILKNRFVRSATHDRTCDSYGFVTENTLSVYRELAEGGVGLIITGHSYIDDKGIASFSMMGIDSDDKIEGLSKIPPVVHEGGAKIIVQINHGGRNTWPTLAKGDILAPSAVPHRVFRNTPRELSNEEVYELIEKFVEAALRARDAGFDGVQLHAAHGYLISQFHSPFTNKRSDEFGGSLENRTRFLREIVEKIKEKTGKNFSLSMKLNSRDFVKEGLTIEESAWIVENSEDWGLDSIEVSGGVMESQTKITKRKITTQEDEAYFRDAALLFKTKTDLPIILVGGCRSLAVMERVVIGGTADFVSLSRPLIKEPNLIEKFKKGISQRSNCKSCAGCLSPENSHLQCVGV